uniref:Uncharacterized protein n=1 Tax=Anguilla anguilla TaxID=7936 RepID=A0A0E9Q8L5_ANGAN
MFYLGKDMSLLSQISAHMHKIRDINYISCAEVNIFLGFKMNF